MTMEQKFNALAAYVLAVDPAAKEAAKKALTAAMRPVTATEPSYDDEMAVHQYLLELGAPPSLLGYKYAVYGIAQAILHPEFTDSMICKFYPMIAMRFDTTPSRVDRSIRHLVEVAWDRCDCETLERYFGNTISAEKGKPTNGHFISQSAIIVKSRLKH